MRSPATLVMVLLVATLLAGRVDAQVVEERYLKATSPEATANLGHSVAVSGDTMVVGAPFQSSSTGSPDVGAAHVYRRDASNDWMWEATLYPSNASVNAGALFGTAVAIDGGTLVVGAELASVGSALQVGAAYVFTRDSSDVWTERAILSANPSSPNMRFGAAVAVSGDRIVVGAPRGDATAALLSGLAYVFGRDSASGMWSLGQVLGASNAQSGDRFGSAVAVDGHTIVVGAPQEDSAATIVEGDGSSNAAQDAGAAYIFVLVNESWTQQAYLKASNNSAGDLFGAAVGASGERVVVGAPGEDVSHQLNLNEGAAYVFVRDAGSWSEEAAFESTLIQRATLGTSVTISGDIVAVGAPGELFATPIMGAVFLYTFEGGMWLEQSPITASNGETGDRFGAAVGLSGLRLAVGAPHEDGNGTSPSNNDAGDAGAAYAFALADTTPPDTTPPVVQAPPDGLDVEATGPVTAVALGDATVTDDSGEDLVASPDTTGPFPLGDTDVTWTAIDSAGNEGSDIQLVRVIDTTAPVVTAPADIVAYPGDAIDLGMATAEDLVGVASITNDWSGGNFPSGHTTVTWTATDTSGNSATDTQIVTIRDRLNLDINTFRVTGRARITRGESIAFTVKVKNVSTNAVDTASLTIVGTIDGNEVYRVDVSGVSDAPGGGATTVEVPPFTVTASTPTGTIMWVMTLTDGNPDVDTITATTRVVP